MTDIVSFMAGDAGRVAVAREIERLKRRVIWTERAGGDRWRQISFLYRAADLFGRRVFEHSFCRGEIGASGCLTGCCCRCRPDVFAYERQVLDLLPKRLDDSGYCPFFNLVRRNCGIYGVRPFACRVYFNFGSTVHYCRNPNDMTLQMFDNLKPHLERVLGVYQGGYQVFPDSALCDAAGNIDCRDETVKGRLTTAFPDA